MASNELEVLDPTATVEKTIEIAAGRALNRRDLMAGLGIAGAAVGAGLMSRSSAGRPRVVEAAAEYTQTDYLNFLLNIKYLQATFYACITQGTDIPANYIVNGTTYRPVLGGAPLSNQPAKVVFTTLTNGNQITDMLNEIYYDELNQLIDLQNLISASNSMNVVGTVAVVRPLIDLLGKGSTTVGTTTVTAAAALAQARMLEDVSVTAYTGVAAFLSGANLTLAAQILGVEGAHASALRLACIQNAVPYQATGYLAFTGVLTSGSAIVANVSSVAGLLVGTAVAGTGIAAGATITVVGTTSVTLSANATASTAANAVTTITTTIPGDNVDVEPVDIGAAAAVKGPSSVSGTSNPTISQGFFATAGSVTTSIPPGFAFKRTTSQVLAVLYRPSLAAALAADTATTVVFEGGFFPTSMNGGINTI